jgi:alkyldihydroxyacetonephosphate synthase
VGRAWYKERFELPYLRDVLLGRGVMVETLETATTWDKLEALHRRLGEVIERAIEGMGVRPLVLAHISHAYPSGASLYYTFLAKMIKGRELEQWNLVKRAATDCILANGGTLSHHHGVGRDHAPWLIAEHGELSVETIRALKQALDPVGIMNPGKILA